MPVRVFAVVLLLLPNPWLLAAPCVLPRAPQAELERALAILAQPPPQRVIQPPSRWKGLLPTRLSMGVRNGTFDQNGYYIGSSSLSERTLGGTDTGWWLRMDWDLRPLWWTAQATAPASDVHLIRTERAEHLAERVGVQLNHLRKAESLALQVSDGDLLCQEAQADAEAALLVIGTVLNAVR